MALRRNVWQETGRGRCVVFSIGTAVIVHGAVGTALLRGIGATGSRHRAAAPWGHPISVQVVEGAAVVAGCTERFVYKTAGYDKVNGNQMNAHSEPAHGD